MQNSGFFLILPSKLITLGYSRKNKTKQKQTWMRGEGGGGWRHNFLKTSQEFFYFNPGHSKQNKSPPLEILQICVRSLWNYSITLTPGISTFFFFLVTLRDSTSFLNTPANFASYFFDITGSSISSTAPSSPVWFFFWNSQFWRC